MDKTAFAESQPGTGASTHGPRKLSPFGHLFRFIGWWFGFTGLYAMFTVCPFCGQQGCPVGIASAGSIGAFFALCVQDWRRLFAFLKTRMGGKAGKGGSTPDGSDTGL